MHNVKLQKEKHGCGLYAVANALDLPNFITPERLDSAKKHGDNIGRLSKYLQKDGAPIYIDPFYFGGDKVHALPEHELGIKPADASVKYLPVIIMVQLKPNGLKHMVAAKIRFDGKVLLIDSLKGVNELPNLKAVNELYYRVFAIYGFAEILTGAFLYI